MKIAFCQIAEIRRLAGKELESMISTNLQTEIHSLSRQEKYRLIKFIAHILEQDETFRRDESSTHSASRNTALEDISKTHAIETFLGKWRGCLRGVDPDDAKRSYLREKYQ